MGTLANSENPDEMPLGKHVKRLPENPEFADMVTSF